VPIEVQMPKLSPTMETGVITQWLVKVGDQVKEGDVLAEIETDKATMPMKSYDDGTVVHLDHVAGDEVALGRRVMVLAKKGEDPKKIAESIGQKAPEQEAQTESEPAKPAKPAPEVAAGHSDAERGPSEDGARQQTARPAAAARSADNGQDEPPAQADESAGGHLKASPLARKIAAASRIDIGQVRGTGPGGRIVRRDVEAHLQRGPEARRTGKAEKADAPAPTSKTAAPVRPVAPALASQRIPHSRMRKTIAQRMLEAKQAAPEIHLSVDVRADRIVAARAEINRHLEPEGVKVSLGDFVTKGVALALRFHPGLNASFEPDAIVRHGEIHIGIAVALEDGLIVPVVHHADSLGLREIRVESEALAAAARSNSLTGEQLSGGTFTISNLGMYGTRQFDAILNLPQVGILAVGAAEKRPVVENDRVEVGTVMTLTLTADHRAVDGALAARFLQTLKGLLEEPASMLV
jgi:pyruvate dehydrogenase E2 component (dihydrolipoamide acetyltransferase)